MEITRQADYALRAVLEVAQNPADRRLTTANIASRQSIPPTFLAKIIFQLSVAGILRTTRGAHGGVALARPSEDINMLEVIEAIDGPIALNYCVINPDDCAFGPSCVMRPVWCDAQADLVTRLRRTTFAGLAAHENGREG